MMKQRVVLEYDADSGAVFDANGYAIMTCLDLKSFDSPIIKANVLEIKIKNILALKQAGFTAEDIALLNKEGMID